MREDHGGIDQKTQHRERKKPWKTLPRMTTPPAELQNPADSNQNRRQDQNPKLMRMEKTMKFSKGIREQGGSRCSARQGRRRHRRSRQAATQRMQAHHSRMRPVRLVRPFCFVML